MNKELVQKTLDYIEDNLKAEICAEDLSNMTGYSVFHFYRLFQNAVGMPVMKYITIAVQFVISKDVAIENEWISSDTISIDMFMKDKAYSPDYLWIVDMQE